MNPFTPKDDGDRGVGGVMGASAGADAHTIPVIAHIADNIPRVGQRLAATLLDRQTTPTPIRRQLDAIARIVITGPKQKTLNVIGRLREKEIAVIQ